MVNCWLSLIDFSPVWTGLADVKVSLQLPISWWLCLGIKLPSAATYWQLSAGQWCSPRWFPLPSGKWWLWILTFPFEIESPDFSGAPDESLSLPIPRAVASFLTGARWLPPLGWSRGIGAGLFMGLGLLRWKLFQECELCCCSVASVWVNIVDSSEKSFRRGQYFLQKK